MNLKYASILYYYLNSQVKTTEKVHKSLMKFNVQLSNDNTKDAHCNLVNNKDKQQHCDPFNK